MAVCTVYKRKDFKMKKVTKILSAALIPAIILSLAACSSNNTSSASVASDASSVASEQSSEATASAPADITAKMQSDIKFPSMAEIGSDRMSSFYEIEADKIDSFSAFICGSGAVPDEIAVFKMKSAEDAESAKSVLLARVDKQKGTFESYTPEEMYKFDGKNVVTNGQYVALIICADNSAATDIFNSMAK